MHLFIVFIIFWIGMTAWKCLPHNRKLSQQERDLEAKDYTRRMIQRYDEKKGSK